MKNLLYSSLTLAFVYLFSSCANDDFVPPTTTGGTVNTTEWLIPTDEVRDGGPGKDGIPSIDSPGFDDIASTDYMDSDDLIIGFKVGEEVRAYTHPVLDWHEIVNDRIGDVNIALTYCPLTGTAIGWDRKINGFVTTFGVSGLLYNSNLIPYDRNTNSNWSQIRLDCVNGALAGREIELFQVVETTWETWQAMYPDSKILTTFTGFSRQYGTYPYGNYRTSEDLIFPVSRTDNRLHPKERVLGLIVEGKVKAYTFDSFETAAVVEDNFNELDLIVAGSKADNYLVAFQRTHEGLTFSAFSNPEFPDVIMKDDEGNEWNIFGEAVVGPRVGERLDNVTSFIGYWFSWAAFYSDVEIFE